MNRDGTYSKGRKRITEPVTKVEGAAVRAAREADAASPRPHESSAGVLFVNRTTGWVVALLLLGLVGGIAYVVTIFFTREHQIEHMDTQMRQQQKTIEDLQARQQELARRVILLETELEALQERSP